MFMYTAVVSLFPYGERKDEVSALDGGRYLGDILASYTALGCYAGTAENVAKQFIYDLHLSPNELPILSGGKTYSIVVVTLILIEEFQNVTRRVTVIAIVTQDISNPQPSHSPKF